MAIMHGSRVQRRIPIAGNDRDGRRKHGYSPSSGGVDEKRVRLDSC